jgi:PKD domain-containing protein
MRILRRTVGLPNRREIMQKGRRMFFTIASLFAIVISPSGTFGGSFVPLDEPVLAGKSATFRLHGDLTDAHWNLGDGSTAEGSSVNHTYKKPGGYRVVVGRQHGDAFTETSSAIVRVHTPETVHLPQIFLDTDARNEVDDQHYIGYGLFSNAVVLGPDRQYRWEKTDVSTAVCIIRDIDEEAMKVDFFNTLRGRPTALPPTE